MGKEQIAWSENSGWGKFASNAKNLALSARGGENFLFWLVSFWGRS